MAYVGQPPFQEFTNPPTKDSFTGDGSTTTFDMNAEVPSASLYALEVYINNVRQEPGTGKAFTLGVDGSNDLKRITFTAAPASGAAIYVVNDKTNASIVAPLQNDLNGTELILDADGDTSITADTDDRIDFKIANVEHFSFSNSSGDTIIKPMVDAKDIVFQQYDGNKILEINDANFVSISGADAGPGELRFYEDTDLGTNYVGFKAPNATESVSYVLPTADGSDGHALKTDGSGTLSWGTAGAISTYSNSTNNRVITSIDSTSVNSEANLTFDGSTLAVTGAATVSGNLTGSGTVQGTTITATTAFVPDASGGADLGTTALEFNDAFFNDSAVINFGNDQDTTLTHTDGTGLTLNSTNKLCFNDASQFIQGASATVLDIAATDEIELTATLIDVVGNFTNSGTIVSAGVVTAAGFTIGSAVIAETELEILDGATVTTTELNLIDGGTSRGTTAVASGDGILINDAGTMAMTNVDTVSTYFASHSVGGGNIVTTGALGSGSIAAGFGAIDNGTSGIRSNTITAETAFVPDASGGADLGTTSLEFNDAFFNDAGSIKFGDDQDVTLTHVADTGLLLNSTMAIQFNDASQYINAPSNAILDINATDEIELNATLVDINANVEISGTATTTGVHTFTAVPVLPANSIDSAHYVDGSIDNAHIADDAIDSEHYAAGSIDTAHLADGQVTIGKLATAVLTGATDIGAAIVDADLLLVDDGAGGTLRKTAASRLKTYIGANTPNFFIRQDAITSVADATRTKIELDVADIDTDSGLDTTNKRWVVPAGKGGTYFVSYGAQFNSATAFGANVGIWKNGGYTQSGWYTNGEESYESFTGSFTIALAAADYLELFARQDSGSTHSTVTADAGIQTFMAGFRLL